MSIVQSKALSPSWGKGRQQVSAGNSRPELSTAVCSFTDVCFQIVEPRETRVMSALRRCATSSSLEPGIVYSHTQDRVKNVLNSSMCVDMIKENLSPNLWCPCSMDQSIGLHIFKVSISYIYQIWHLSCFIPHELQCEKNNVVKIVHFLRYLRIPGALIYK